MPTDAMPRTEPSEGSQKHYEPSEGSGDHIHIDQRAANYAPASSLSASCATCIHFRPDGSYAGQCAKVSGPIRPDYTCDLFAAGPLTPVATEDYGLSYDPDTGDFSASFALKESNDDLQVAFGWANIAVEKDGSVVVDAHGDSIRLGELELAAYNFVLRYRESGDMHEGEARALLIESVVFTPEKCEALGLAKDALPGGWWVGFYVPDTDLWKLVKSGDRPMFSIQGRAVKETADA